MSLDPTGVRSERRWVERQSLTSTVKMGSHIHRETLTSLNTPPIKAVKRQDRGSEISTSKLQGLNRIIKGKKKYSVFQNIDCYNTHTQKRRYTEISVLKNCSEAELEKTDKTKSIIQYDFCSSFTNDDLRKKTKTQLIKRLSNQKR